MKTALAHLLSVILLAYSVKLKAQSSYESSCYGSDPLLYNGVLYRYYVSPSTTGTQFFLSNDFSNGSVKVRGVNFSGVSLNYDVRNQQLVLLYDTPSGGIERIVISDAWLEAFTLYDDQFEVHPLADSSAKIFRVVGNDTIKIYFHYIKDMVLGSGVSALNMQFTSLIRTSYLYKGTELLKFQGNRSFVNLFNESQRQELRRFMRKNNINVRKADDSRLRKLLEYCNSLRT